MDLVLFTNIMDWMAYLTGLIGAPLGIIEIFNPALADKIEDYLDYQGGDHQFEGNLERMATYMISGRYSSLIAIAGLISFLMVVYDQISIHSPLINRIETPVVLWIFVWFIFGLSISAITVHGMAVSIKFFNKITNGRALGGIGLLLIILGVIGDTSDKLLSWIYQL